MPFFNTTDNQKADLGANGVFILNDKKDFNI